MALSPKKAQLTASKMAKRLSFLENGAVVATEILPAAGKSRQVTLFFTGKASHKVNHQIKQALSVKYSCLLRRVKAYGIIDEKIEEEKLRPLLEKNPLLSVYYVGEKTFICKPDSKMPRKNLLDILQACSADWGKNVQLFHIKNLMS